MGRRPRGKNARHRRGRDRLRLHNLKDVAWRELFASSEGAEDHEAQLTGEGVWIRVEPGTAAAALDWLHGAVEATNALRQQLEAEAKAVEAEVAEWEERRRQ